MDGDRVLLAALSDPDLCRAAVEIGRGRGFKVVATLQADDALVVAHQRRPDAVIAGMDMITHDGASLLHGLKRHPETRHIPIVVTHSAKAAEDAHQGRLAGALDVVEEPISRPQLDEVLDELDAFLNAAHRRLLVVTEQAEGARRDHRRPAHGARGAGRRRRRAPARRRSRPSTARATAASSSTSA